MLVLQKEARRESSMCDPFCEHPAFLAKAILTLVPDPAVPLRHALLDVGLRAELPAAAGALHHAVPRPPVGQVRPPQQALPLRQGRLGQLPEGHLRRQGASILHDRYEI